jgi:hypothetical protein
MNRVKLSLIPLVVGFLTSGLSEPPAPRVAVGSLTFDEQFWRRGTLPTLTFTVSAGRGPLEKSIAFLYVSEEPQAFTTTPFGPQFVGEFVGSGSVQVVVDRKPERSPITSYSRERFVQGAVFDAHTGDLESVTNEVYLDIVYDGKPDQFAINFQTEDDFTTPLVNGQDLSTPPEFGVLFALSSLPASSGPAHFGPAIFNSTPGGPNNGSSDPDLLVNQGNVLILQENPGQLVAGIFGLPDDAANGGKLVFDFTGFQFIEKVEPVSLDLVDIDSGSPRPSRVVLTDVLGHTRTYLVPVGWTRDITFQGTPGVGTLDLTTLAAQPGYLSSATASESPGYIPGEIVRLEVEIGGSGALDNLVFRREADPDSAPVKNPGPGRQRKR